MRNNWGVMRNGMVQRRDAASKDFWDNTAPSLAPTLDGSGALDKLRTGKDMRAMSAYGGDYHTAPWDQPNAPAGQPAPQTKQPVNAAPSALDRLKGFFGGSSSQAAPQPQAQAAPPNPFAQELARRQQAAQ